jgi:hypothetical protein
MIQVICQVLLNGSEQPKHPQPIGEAVVPLAVFQKAVVRSLVHQDGQRMAKGGGFE